MSIKRFALDKLIEKFEGVSESILSRVATKIAETAKDEEGASTQVENITLQGVIDSYADFRASEASKTSVKKYEEKFSLKDGKPLEQQKDETERAETKNEKEDKDTPSYVKALMESVAALTSEVSSLKAGKVADARKSKVDKLLTDAPENLKKSILREYGRAKFENDDDFNSWIDEIKPDVEDAVNNLQASKGIVNAPKGGNNAPKEANKQVVERVNVMLENAGMQTPAIRGLQTTK